MDRSNRAAWLIVALTMSHAVLPLLTIDSAWEFHRDELLYFAMGDHLDLMRMQFPPLIAMVAAASKAGFGASIWAARVPAAVAGALLVGVALWLVRRLGGGQGAISLAAIGLVAAPVFLRSSVLFQPVGFDQLFALVAVAGILLAGHEREPRWWLVAGLGLGLGAMTKFSAAFYAASLLLPVLTIPELRRHLKTRWPWFGMLGAGLLASPSLTGQIVHGWPFLAQLEALRAAQLERVQPAAFLMEQPLLLGGAVILAIAGLGAMRHSVAARVSGLFALGLVGVMLALGGKGYYAAPGYPALIAVGAVALESLRPVFRWLAAAPMVAATVIILPMGIPVLGPSGLARYAARLGVTQAVQTNQGAVLDLPQDYADMLGWRDLAEATAAVWHRLTPAEQAEGIVAAGNYGQAGALAMYHRKLGFPYPASAAGDFHAWGLGNRTGRVAVIVDGASARKELERLFEEVEEVARVEEPRAVPGERDRRIFVARRPRRPLTEVWPTLGPRWG